MCPELQPRLSECQNKLEGKCSCKVFCKQQMQYLKTFVSDRNHLSKIGQLPRGMTYEGLKQDIDDLCSVKDQDHLFQMNNISLDVNMI